MFSKTVEQTITEGKKLCECGCGEVIRAVTYGKKRKFKLGHAGRGKRGHRSHSWKGGRIRVTGGHIKIWNPEHPYADCQGYVFEHRLLMEKCIGRYLVPNIDDVHHINGIKYDNRIENLQLLTHAEHLSHHKTIDMSGRKCTQCGSTTTKKQHARDRPNWYHSFITGGMVCKRCYKKEYGQTHKEARNDYFKEWKLRRKIMNTLPR